MARPHDDPELLRKVSIEVFMLIAEQGVAGASVRQVAERVGLSTGTLNYHFRNKEGLVRAALDYAYREPFDWGDHRASAKKALRRLFQRYVLRKPEVRAWWRFWCAITAHAELGQHQKKNQRMLIAFFARVIADGVKRGELRQGLHARSEAERLVALAHGLALRQLVDPVPQVRAMAAALLEAEVEGLS